MDITNKILKVIFDIILVMVIVILLLFARSKFIIKDKVPNVFGFSVLKVVSGSMRPTIKVFDYILIKKEKDYKVKDIVTYVDENGTIVTHRIVKIDGSKITTKGDANNTDDPVFEKVNIKGKVILKFHSIFSNVNLLTIIIFLILTFIIGFIITIFIPDKKR